MTPSVASEEETHARRSPRPGKMLSPDVQTFFHRARAYSSNAAAKHVRWSTELGSSLLTRREVEQRLQRRTTESLQEMIALYRSSSRCSQTVLNPYAKISVPHSDLERESSVSQQDSMKDMIDDSSVSICSVQTPVDLIRSRERYQRYFTHLCTTIARRVRFQQRLLKLSNFRSAAGDKLSFPDSKDLQTRGGLARNVESTYCENDSIQDLNWTPIASSAIPVIRSDTENSFESFEIDTSTTDGKNASENLSEPRMRHLNWDVRLHFYDIEPNRVPFDYHLREYPTFPFISHPFIVGGMPLQDLRPFLLDAEWKALSQAHGAMKENRRFGNEKQVTQRSVRGVQNTNSENVKVGATSELHAFYMYEAQICQSNIEARKLKSSNNKALNFTFVDGNNWPRCSVAGVPGTVPVFTQPISFPLLPPGFQYPIDQISPIAPQTHVEALTVELQKERTLTGNENLSSSRLLLPFTNLKYNKHFYARGKIMRQPASDDIMSDDEEEEEHDEVSDDVATVKVIGGTVHEEIGISGNSNGNSNEKKKYQGSIAHIRTLIAASQHPKNLLPLSLGLMGEDEQKRGMRNPPWFIPFEWTAEEEIPVRNFDLGFENECLRERIVQNKSSIEALTGSFHGAAKWVL